MPSKYEFQYAVRRQEFDRDEVLDVAESVREELRGALRGVVEMDVRGEGDGYGPRPITVQYLVIAHDDAEPDYIAAAFDTARQRLWEAFDDAPRGDNRDV